MGTYILYNFILITCMVFGYLCQKSSTNQQELFCRFICFLSLTIPASLRYYTGTDYGNYAIMFYDFNDLYNTEILWIFLYEATHWLQLDVQWIFVFSAILIYYPLCFKIKRQYLCIALVLYIILGHYFKSYNGIRQLIAVSFIIWSFVCYEDKKYIKMLILLCIAIGFHKSALLIPPLMICAHIVNINFKNKYMPIIILSILACIIIFFDIISLLFKIGDLLSISYITRYANNEQFTGKLSLISTLGIIPRISFLIFGILTYKKIISQYPRQKILMNLSFLTILAYIMATDVLIFSRLRDLFIFVPILLGGIIFNSLNKNMKILFLLCIIINIVVFNRSIYTQTREVYYSNEIYPYYSIFNKDDFKEW